MDTLKIDNREFLFPKNGEYRRWDASDEYLLSEELEGKTLVINDNFGALTLGIDNSVSYTTSFVSYKFINYALELNNQTRVVTTNFNELPDDIDSIVLKLPKSLDQLEYLLQLIGQKYPGKRFIACGMIKYMPISMVRLVENYFTDVKTSLAKKKARLIYGTTSICENPKNFPVKYQLMEKYNIVSYPGTFCYDSLDIGTRFLIPHIPKDISGKIIDLGCASGILGLIAKDNNPSSEVYLTDESVDAIESAKLTFKENGLEGNFVLEDKLGGFVNNFADLILCNPPFHQNTRIVTDIANSMFKQSKKILKRGGRLLVVANKHLGYHKSLRKIFHNLKIIDSNSKFNIYSSYKQ